MEREKQEGKTAKMIEKFKDFLKKKEEASARRNEVKEEKKAKMFGMFMTVQNKKLMLEERKLEIKGTSVDSKMLSVKTSELDPDEAKIVQEYHASILKPVT